MHGLPVLEPLARVFDDAAVESCISLINVVLVIKSLFLSEVEGAVKLVSISIGVGIFLEPVFDIKTILIDDIAIGIARIVPVRFLPRSVSPIDALTVTSLMVNFVLSPVLKIVSCWIKWPLILVLCVASLLLMIVIFGQTQAIIVRARLHVLELLEGLRVEHIEFVSNLPESCWVLTIDEVDEFLLTSESALLIDSRSVNKVIEVGLVACCNACHEYRETNNLDLVIFVLVFTAFFDSCGLESQAAHHFLHDYGLGVVCF